MAGHVEPAARFGCTRGWSCRSYSAGAVSQLCAGITGRCLQEEVGGCALTAQPLGRVLYAETDMSDRVLSQILAADRKVSAWLATAYAAGSSLFGGLRSSAFRPSTFPMFDVTRGPLLLFGISSVALPVWDQKNEAAQSVARSDRARRDRDKSPSELTSSIVPRGTSLHRLADLVILLFL